MFFLKYVTFSVSTLLSTVHLDLVCDLLVNNA